MDDRLWARQLVKWRREWTFQTGSGVGASKPVLPSPGQSFHCSARSCAQVWETAQVKTQKVGWGQPVRIKASGPCPKGSVLTLTTLWARELSCSDPYSKPINPALYGGWLKRDWNTGSNLENATVVHSCWWGWALTHDMVHLSQEGQTWESTSIGCGSHRCQGLHRKEGGGPESQGRSWND